MAFILLALWLPLIAADLQFGKTTAPISSSAQYRSVILPRVLGGQTVDSADLKVKTEKGSRQKYYKPKSNRDHCPTSPLTTYLNDSDQADLYTLIKSSRQFGAEDDAIRDLINTYMKNTLTAERFQQFTIDYDLFEKNRCRRHRDHPVRMYAKQKPEAIRIKDKRHLREIIDAPTGFRKMTFERIN